MYSVIKDKHHQLIILIIVAFAIIIDGLDQSVVNVALPVIAGSFGVDITTGSWVVMIYSLLLAGFLLPFAKIADNARIRQIFLTGFLVFIAGSVLCAASGNMEMMVAGRGIQGIGASMIAGSAPLCIAHLLPMDKQGLGMGVIAAASGVAFAFGPALGGFLTAFLSWHWIFLINIPLGIAAIIMISAYIPEADTKPEKRPFDWLGTFLLFFTISAFLLTLERGPVLGWTSPVILGFIGIFIVCLVLFIIRSKTGKDPIINIGIFRNWKFTSVTLSYFLTCGLFYGAMYITPYYLEGPLQLDTATAGLLLMITAIISALISIPAGRWGDKAGCRTPCIVAAILRIMFSILLIIALPDLGILGILPALIVMGFAFGISGGPSATRIIQFSPKGEEGTGSSLMMTAVYLGGVTGVALYSTVFSLAEPSSIGVTVTLLPSDVFMGGFVATSILGLVLAILTLVFTVIVPNYKNGHEIKRASQNKR